MNSPHASSRVRGCLLGVAVADALGLAYEGLSPGRAARLLGPPDRYRLLGPWGMVSDDSEHNCLVAEALILSGGDLARFQRALAWRLRFWLLGLPAGIGWATLRAILKLWLGFSPQRSGVDSAGNGPAMRAPILGAAVVDEERLWPLVQASARISHRDPRAAAGAYAVALATRLASRDPQVAASAYLAKLAQVLDREAPRLLELIRGAADSAGRGESTPAFATSLGLQRGVSGFVEHSVPVALHAWLSHPQDYRAAVQAVILCGGDTDTTGAMVGGILGAALGQEGIPAAWLARLVEWPSSVSWMERLADQLARCQASGQAGRRRRLPLVALWPRNLLFMGLVLAHGLRRLAPPY